MMRYHFDPGYTFVARRTGATENPDLRVSDAERNEVAETLSRHFADGRLDQGEFKERLDRAMGAKTRGDLNGLFDDLPRLPAATTHPVPARRRRRLVPFLLIIAFFVVAADLTVPYAPFVHGPHLTWLLFVIAGLYFWTRSRRWHHHSHG